MSKAREGSYKIKSTVTGVDKRVLRGYRRSLDWKESRNDVVNRRRNIQDAAHAMSPVAEKPTDAVTKVSDQPSGQAISNSRKDMLLKWKQEKELKKKLQSMEEAKKKPFRMAHVAPELVPFKKEFVKLPKIVHDAAVSIQPPKPSVAARSNSRSASNNVVTSQARSEVNGRQLRSSGKENGLSKGVSCPSAKANKIPAQEKPKPLPAGKMAQPNIHQIRAQPVKSVPANTDKRTTRSQANASKSSSSSLQQTVKQVGAKLPAKSSVQKPVKCAEPGKLAPRSGSRRNPITETTKGVNGMCFVATDDAVTSPVEQTAFQGVGNWVIEERDSMTKKDTRRQSKRARISLGSETDDFKKPESKRQSQKLISEADSGNTDSNLLSLTGDAGVVDTNTESMECSDLSMVKTPFVEIPAMSLDFHKSYCSSVKSRRSSARIRKSVLVEQTEEKLPKDTMKEADGMKAVSHVESDSTESEKCIDKDTASTDVKNLRGIYNPHDSVHEGKSMDHFVTPGRSLRAMSITPAVNSSMRKTPRNLRNSLILRKMSPEEGIEILKQSPMIEINRRRSVRVAEAEVVAPMPNFDDVDDIFDATPGAERSATATAVSQQPSSSTVDVLYFRNLVVDETNRLTTLCTTWRAVMDVEPELSEEVKGSIRSTIGKAELLMVQRFKQFSGLIDNCEFKTGEKDVTCMDLQGFWDMIYFQIEDVNKMFLDLDHLKAANWIVAKPSTVKRKVIKKKVVPAAGTQPASSGVSLRPNFAAFRRQMKLQQQKIVSVDQNSQEMITEDTEDSNSVKLPVQNAVMPATPSVAVPCVISGPEMKTFEGGFFVVSSPVRQSPAVDGKGSNKKCSIETSEGSSLAKKLLRRSVRKSLNLASGSALVEDQSSFTVKSHDAADVVSTTESDPVVTNIGDAPSVHSEVLGSELCSVDRRPLRSILHNAGSKEDVVNGDVMKPLLPSIEQSDRKGRHAARKSVCFLDTSNSAGSGLKESSFMKYIMPSELSIYENSPFSDVATPIARLNTPADSSCQQTPRLVDITDEDEMDGTDTSRFGGLKVGFTPGMDGKTRRVSGFSPVQASSTPINIMATLDEENVNLMQFSPANVNTMKGRRSSTRKHEVSRRSCRLSTRLSLISD